MGWQAATAASAADWSSSSSSRQGGHGGRSSRVVGRVRRPLWFSCRRARKRFCGDSCLQQKGTLMLKRAGLLAAFIVLAAVSFPCAAAALSPTRVQMPVEEVQLLPGGSLCPFDVTFTGTGTITVTTYYDKAGNPISQTVHGALMHTIFSAWHTLTSKGPAPVHTDLATGQTVLTGKEFAFHVPATVLSSLWTAA